MILGLGTDLVQISRIAGALERLGEPFARRILAPAEWQEFVASARPARFLAKRFAVKEAAAKALGTGMAQGVSWQHIQVHHDALGAPRLELQARARELQRLAGIDNMHISLSDEKDMVVAVVLMEGPRQACAFAQSPDMDASER